MQTFSHEPYRLHSLLKITFPFKITITCNMEQQQQQPLKNETIHPHENDVLLGRGGNNNRHVGNERLRTLARSYVHLYTQATKKGKSNISWDLVQAIRSTTPSGRFLKRDSFTGSWQDVGDEVAREKTSQAMRDAIAISMNHDIFRTDRYMQDANPSSAPKKTHSFPVHAPSINSWEPYSMWHSSKSHPSYAPLMYASPINNHRPRSWTTDSAALVSPENTKIVFPPDPIPVPVHVSYPTSQYSIPNWTPSPVETAGDPRSTLYKDNSPLIPENTRRLDSWDDDGNSLTNESGHQLDVKDIQHNTFTLRDSDDYEPIFESHSWNDSTIGV